MTHICKKEISRIHLHGDLTFQFRLILLSSHILLLKVERGELMFSILPAALGPGVYSASNINDYQKQKNNVSEK
jgi:hypothetical protein